MKNLNDRIICLKDYFSLYGNGISLTILVILSFVFFPVAVEKFRDYQKDAYLEWPIAEAMILDSSVFKDIHKNRTSVEIRTSVKMKLQYQKRDESWQDGTCLLLSQSGDFKKNTFDRGNKVNIRYHLDTPETAIFLWSDQAHR